jgi:hypothetical protein
MNACTLFLLHLLLEQKIMEKTMAKHNLKNAKKKPVRQQKKIESLIPKLTLLQNNYPYIITGIFFILSFIGILNHEMWRDEYQAWMVANDAHSIAGLFQNLKYEGNPVLWHAFLYIFTILSSNPLIMQLFHILISAAFIYLINKYGPFSILNKILFTFGYYAFYEYNLISRGYGLGLLLIFIFCILYKDRHKYYIPISIVFFLLSNSTVFGLMLSVCFTGILFVDYIITYKKKEACKVNSCILAVAGFIIISGWLTGIAQIKPEPDSSFPVSYPQKVFEPARAQYALSKIVASYVPIPPFAELHFWNKNMFVDDKTIINPIYPILLILAFTIGFLRNRLVALLYVGGTLLILVFHYYTLLLYYRYLGHLFILVLVCYWLAEYYKTDSYRNKFMNGLATIGNKISKPLFTLILAAGFIGGVGAYCEDLANPFSTSLEAAKYIKKNNLQNMEIIGCTDFIISPLATLLNKKIFYPERKEYGTFIIWDKKRNPDLKFEVTLSCIVDMAQKGNNRFLLIMANPLLRVLNGQNTEVDTGMLTDDLKVTLINKIEPGIVEEEKYYIYTIDKVPLTSAPD